MAAHNRTSARRWTHLIVLAAVAVTVPYLTWRLLATVGDAALWLAIPLWLLELHGFVTFCLFLLITWDQDAVTPPPAARTAPGRVAVLIPTFNEPIGVLLPTVAAAARLRLVDTVWILDDGDRPWVRHLAEELGVGYLTRPDRRHAKAGNVNAALRRISADYVLLLDADHVVHPNLLSRTLGYFEDPSVAFVQLPQEFYNEDSFEHVDRPFLGRLLGRRMAGRRFTEQGLFYRVMQPGRNRWNAAFCCGTNAIFRATALRDVGGFATDSITEDILTSLRLHRRGWRSVYHNEVLARGLAAADPEQYLSQRLRWGRGAMQVLRKDNPLLGPGLTIPQRLCYLATLIGWFDAWRTFGFIVLPIIVLCTGASPVAAHFGTFVPAFLVVFLLQQLAMARVAGEYASIGRSLMFEVIRMPANMASTLALVTDRGATFQVTSKGRLGRRRRRLPAPLLHRALFFSGVGALVIYALTLAGLSPITYGLPIAAHTAAAWLIIDVVLVVLAMRRITNPRFASERRSAVRFRLATAPATGIRPLPLQDLSVTGARLELPESTRLAGGEEVRLTLHAPGISREPIDLEAVVAGRRADEVALSFYEGQLGPRAALSNALHSGFLAAGIERVELRRVRSAA